MLVFEGSEYKERVKKTKRRMEESGIEILLLTNPANINYLSGYDSWSFYVHQMLILMIDEEMPIWVGRPMDANGARLDTWLSHENILEYADDYVQSSQKHPMNFVSDVLKRKKWDKKSIGVEMDSYYFTAKCFQELKRDLINAEFHNAELLVNRIRLVKSDKEIAIMKQAADIANNVMRVAVESVKEGVRECDVVASIYYTQIRGTDKHSGGYTSMMPFIRAGRRWTAPHSTWTDDTFKKGEATTMELAGCRHRYNCPMTRTVYVGKAPQKLKDTAKIVADGLAQTLDAITPGITCEDVERTWRNATAKSNIVRKSRLGYPVGLSYPPDWGEHSASLREGDKTVLEPNMTFHLLAGLWLEQYGVLTSETFRVTENGSESLADIPRILFEK